MKKAFKIVLVLLLVLIVGAGSILGYISFALPDTGPADDTLKVAITPERVARGKYLAHSVTVCMDCHSKRDWSHFSGPIMPGTSLGQGGERFDEAMGMPGTIYARNITPGGIAQWTDGELLRVITTGVNKKGEAIFPLMPYHNYGRMDKEDILSIIAYIRTLQPVQNTIPPTKLNFPMNFIVKTIPSKAAFAPKPAETDVVGYGQYLVNAAACMDCHTKFEKGQLVGGTEFGGGREFQFPGGMVTSPNISPDAETGIGSWTREAFVNRFRAYADSNYHPVALTPTDFNSPMPWTMYGTMTESDLSAIYAYLRTVKPQKNKVVKFQPQVAKVAMK